MGLLPGAGSLAAALRTARQHVHQARPVHSVIAHPVRPRPALPRPALPVSLLPTCTPDACRCLGVTKRIGAASEPQESPPGWQACEQGVMQALLSGCGALAGSPRSMCSSFKSAWTAQTRCPGRSCGGPSRRTWVCRWSRRLRPSTPCPWRPPRSRRSTPRVRRLLGRRWGELRSSKLELASLQQSFSKALLQNKAIRVGAPALLARNSINTKRHKASINTAERLCLLKPRCVRMKCMLCAT